MGPSMSIDGVADRARRSACPTRSFNGAVDEHRRSHVARTLAALASNEGFNGAVDEHRRSRRLQAAPARGRVRASMGPSMSIDGVRSRARSIRSGTPGFNGAVDEHRRSPMSAEQERLEAIELQWGRR